MAPTKRRQQSVAAKAGEPIAKVLKTSCKPQTAVELILSAINHPLVLEGVPEDCRKMLAVAVPKSLCVPADQRHDIQNEVVSMLGELVSGVATKLQEAVDRENLGLADVEQTRVHLEDVVVQATAALHDAEEAMRTRKTTQDEMSRATKDATAALGKRKADQSASDAALEVVTSEKDRLEASLAADLAVLARGACDVAEAKQHVDSLMMIAAKLSLDSSLLQAMPSSLTKKPDVRGPFDTMVMAQLQESFQQRIKVLEVKADEFAPQRSDVEAATNAAASALSDAEASEAAAVSALDAASMAQQEATAAKANAEAATAMHAPEYAEATKARDARRAAAKDFGAVTRAFEELRDKSEKAAAAAATEPAVGTAPEGGA